MSEMRLNPTIAKQAFLEGRDADDFETVFISHWFTELIIAHNEGELGFITGKLEDDQVEDRLLGLAVENMLNHRRSTQNSLGAMVLK